MECDPPVCNGKDCQQNATHVLLENMSPYCSVIRTCYDCYNNMYELCDFTTKLSLLTKEDLGSCPWEKWDEKTGLKLFNLTYSQYLRMRCILQNMQVLCNGKLKSETNRILLAATKILSVNIDLIRSLL